MYLKNDITSTMLGTVFDLVQLYFGLHPFTLDLNLLEGSYITLKVIIVYC